MTVNGIVQQPQRSSIGLSAAGGQHYQRTEIRIGIDPVHALHSLFLMLIGDAVIDTAARRNPPAGCDFLSLCHHSSRFSVILTFHKS